MSRPVDLLSGNLCEEPMPLPPTYRRHYTAVAFGTLITIGLWDGARGVVLPHFLADMALTPTAGAAILVSAGAGYGIGALGFGVLSNRFGLKRLNLAGCLLAAAMLALFAVVRHPALLYATMVTAGLGIAMLDLSVSLPLSILYGERQGGILNLLHGFFGAGALTGPLLAAALLAAGAGWRVPYLLPAALYLIWSAWYAGLPEVPLPVNGTGPDAPKVTAAEAASLLGRDPLARAAVLALAAGVAAEAGVGLWLPSYLQAEKAMAEAQAALFTTVFFAGFTAGRMLAPPLLERTGYARGVALLALAGGAGLAMLVLLPGTAWLSAVAGVGTGAIFPTCVALVSIRYPALVGHIYAAMYGGAAIAMIAIGPLMGRVGEQTGLTAAMWLPVACYAGVALLLGYYHSNRARPPRCRLTASPP
jgi:fucose permease